jgi:hypothetical protein
VHVLLSHLGRFSLLNLFSYYLVFYSGSSDHYKRERSGYVYGF